MADLLPQRLTPLLTPASIYVSHILQLSWRKYLQVALTAQPLKGQTARVLLRYH